jgi:glycosyltransferase involved in cell wall biosynthesis
LRGGCKAESGAGKGRDKESLMPARVSLAIPVFNGEKYLEDAIRSILAQDYQDFELIISDNASTDGTEQICRDFAAGDARIKYFRNERNLGAAPNYNRGFVLASGEYFKWCAADDRMSPNYVGACVRALDAHPEAVLAFGTTYHIDAEGRPIVQTGKRMPAILDATPARRFYRAVGDGCWTVDQESFGLYRSEALRKSGLHRSYYGSDHTLLREMALLGTFVKVPSIAFYNRIHPEQSIRIPRGQKSAWQDTSRKKATSMPHVRYMTRYLNDLFATCIRHRRLVSPLKTLPSVVFVAMSPRGWANCAIDVIGLISPGAETWLRDSYRGLKNKARIRPEKIMRQA